MEVILVVDYNPELFGRARDELSGERVLENAGVRGLSGGRNTGLAAAAGEIAILLDDDAEADPGWLAALLRPYDGERVVATGGTGCEETDLSMRLGRLRPGSRVVYAPTSTVRHRVPTGRPGAPSPTTSAGSSSDGGAHAGPGWPRHGSMR